MHVGFDLIPLTDLTFYPHAITLAPGIYSILTCHFIIPGEGSFLVERFGDAYSSHRRRVRRYL